MIILTEIYSLAWIFENKNSPLINIISEAFKNFSTKECKKLVNVIIKRELIPKFYEDKLSQIAGLQKKL